MLTLHTFGAALGLPDASPFCMKLEAFLQIAGIPFERRPITNLAEAPKGKGPWIEENGQKLGDTALIIRHLEASRSIDLDRHLSTVERAAGHALAVMLEERTYFVLLHERWIEDANWPLVRDQVLGDLPPPVQSAIRESQLAKLRAQGLGLHSREEKLALAASDIEALAAWLGRKPFMMGEQPTKLDATASAFVLAMQAEALDTPLTAMVRSHPSLVAYGRRSLERFFPTFRVEQKAA